MKKPTTTSVFLRSGVAIGVIGSRAEIVELINSQRSPWSNSLITVKTWSPKTGATDLDLDPMAVVLVGVEDPEQEDYNPLAAFIAHDTDNLEPSVTL